MKNRNKIIKDFIWATIFLIVLYIAEYIYIKYTLGIAFDSNHVKILIKLTVFTYSLTALISIIKKKATK